MKVFSVQNFTGYIRNGTGSLCRRGVPCRGANSEGFGTTIFRVPRASRISFNPLPLVSRIHTLLPMDHPSSSGNDSCTKEDTVTTIADRYSSPKRGQDCGRQVL